MLKILIVLNLLFPCYSWGAMSFSKFSLKQAVNMPAIKMFSSVLKEPSLCMPHEELTHLSELNLDRLKDKGIKYLVFDKDNTLCHTYSNELHYSTKAKIAECHREFPSSSIAILSNSVGTPDDVGFAGAVETEAGLGIPVIRHAHKKPGCIQEVQSALYSCE